jgi:hypothetical protein
MKKRTPLFLFKRGDIFRKWDKAEKRDIPGDQKFTFRDILAMILAVFSIVLPWILAILGCLALVLFLFWKFYLHG